MKRDVLGVTQIVIGAPATITAPTFVAVDEASMIHEVDLHAALAWLYPVILGIFGDSRQIGLRRHVQIKICSANRSRHHSCSA